MDKKTTYSAVVVAVLAVLILVGASISSGRTKEYTNNELGFSVEIPANWKTQEQAAGDVIPGRSLFFMSPGTYEELERRTNDPNFVGEGPAIEFMVLHYGEALRFIQERVSHVGDCYPAGCPNIDTTEEYLEKFNIPFERVQIAGTEGLKFTEDGLYQMETVYLERGGALYVLSFTKDANVSPEVKEKILASFRFTI